MISLFFLYFEIAVLKTCLQFSSHKSTLQYSTNRHFRSRKHQLLKETSQWRLKDVSYNKYRISLSFSKQLTQLLFKDSINFTLRHFWLIAKICKRRNGVCLWVWSPRFTTIEQINTTAPSTISVMYTYITLSGLNIYAGRSVWGNILYNSEEF